MARSVKRRIDEANAAVPLLGFEEARALTARGGVLIVDVRAAPELAPTGTIAGGGRHVSRGMLDFWADPASTYHDADFGPARPVLVCRASGGRWALGGKVLKDMGYSQVFDPGGIKDWAEAGGEADHPVDAGMS